MEKVIQIDCGSQEKCAEILEKVDEELSASAEVVAEVRGGKIRFRIIGFEADVQRTAIRLREVLYLIKKSRSSPRHGVRSEELAKLAKKTVPLDLLAMILRINGISAQVRGSTIYADTDMDTLITYAKELGEAVEKASRLQLPYTTRKFVAACSAITGLEPHQVVRKAIELEIVNENGELRLGLEEAVRRFLESCEYEEF